jgi:hypothetical protein
MATTLFDLTNGALIKLAYKPAAIITATVAGTTNSKIIDCKDASTHLLTNVVITPGTITDGTYTWTVNESDASDMSGATAATSGPDAGSVALTSADSLGVGGVTGACAIIRFYRQKRYIQVINTVSGSPSTGGFMSATLIAPLNRQGATSSSP